MGSEDITRAVEDVQRLVNPAGVALHILAWDEVRRVVVLEVRKSEIPCSECALTSGDLSAVVVGALQEVEQDLDVVLLEAGDGGVLRRYVTPRDPLIVVNPSTEDLAAEQLQLLSQEPLVASLNELRIGFRVDTLWRTWDWIVDEWTNSKIVTPARIEHFRRTQGLIGSEALQQEARLQEFVGSIDVAVVGLANCGSCTSWTIKDAITVASAGLPTIAVATSQFVPLAHKLASEFGRPSLRVLELPYPLESKSESEVRGVAHEAWPHLLGLLGAAG